MKAASFLEFTSKKEKPGEHVLNNGQKVNKGGRPVSPTEALSCIEHFRNLMEDESDPELVYYRLKLGRTLSVSFTGLDLREWINKIMDKHESAITEIRVMFGIYTSEYIMHHAKHFTSAEKDRISVFLWPYKNGQPSIDSAGMMISPYNFGTLAP